MKSPQTDQLTELTKPLQGNRCRDGVIPETPIGRLAFVAEALGVPMSSDLAADLLDADGGPAKAVQTFCIMHGASLDFIYTGDVMPLVRYTAKAMKESRI